MNGDAVFREKLTGGLKNDIRNLGNFHEISQKSENLNFNMLLLSIVYKVSAIKSTEELSHGTTL